jgi:hypothetical protein
MRLAALLLLLAACTKPEPPTPPPAPSNAPAEPAASEELVLVADGGACTEKYCGPQHPCCNRCELVGWHPPGAEANVSVADGVEPLPTDVRIDSCERGDYHLSVRATRAGGDVIVHSWTRVPGAGV